MSNSAKNNGTPVTPLMLGAGTSYAVNTVLASCDPIAIGHAKAGEVRVSAGVTSLTWYSAATRDGDYLPCRDSGNTAVSQTVVSTAANSLPAALFGRAFVKALPNANGTIEVLTQT